MLFYSTRWIPARHRHHPPTAQRPFFARRRGGRVHRRRWLWHRGRKSGGVGKILYPISWIPPLRLSSQNRPPRSGDVAVAVARAKGTDRARDWQGRARRQAVIGGTAATAATADVGTRARSICAKPVRRALAMPPATGRRTSAARSPRTDPVRTTTDVRRARRVLFLHFYIFIFFHLSFYFYRLLFLNCNRWTRSNRGKSRGIESGSRAEESWTCAFSIGCLQVAVRYDAEEREWNVIPIEHWEGTKAVLAQGSAVTEQNGARCELRGSEGERLLVSFLVYFLTQVNIGSKLRWKYWYCFYYNTTKQSQCFKKIYTVYRSNCST